MTAVKKTSIEALRKRKARDLIRAQYTDVARSRQRRRTRQLDEAVSEADALMIILESWEEGQVRLPGRFSDVGGRLREKIRIVVEEHLELVLEEVDAVAAGKPYKWPTS